MTALANAVCRLSRPIFQPCQHNSLLKCAPKSKIAKSTNLLFWEFMVIWGHRLTPLKSSSLVLVMISNMSVSICNCFHA